VQIHSSQTGGLSAAHKVGICPMLMRASSLILPNKYLKNRNGSQPLRTPHAKNLWKKSESVEISVERRRIDPEVESAVNPISWRPA
jgi:hypothetical protein